MRMPERYRPELDNINEFFGGKAVLTWKDVQRYTGKGRKWCEAHLDIPHGDCTAVKLAYALSKL